MNRQENSVVLKRLKSKILIERLFSQGEAYHTKYLMLRVLKNDQPIVYAGVSVPKRNLKRAVDRNKVKRQLRQVLKSEEKNLNIGGAYMLIYKGNELPLTKDLLKQCKNLFEKI